MPAVDGHGLFPKQNVSPGKPGTAVTSPSGGLAENASTEQTTAGTVMEPFGAEEALTPDRIAPHRPECQEHSPTEEGQGQEPGIRASRMDSRG